MTQDPNTEPATEPQPEAPDATEVPDTEPEQEGADEATQPEPPDATA